MKTLQLLAVWGLEVVAVSAAYCVKTLAPIGGGPRQEQSVVAAGDKIYIVAGLRKGAGLRGENITSAVEVYDTVKDTWSDVAPLPFAVHHSNVAAVDGKLYYLGGLYSATGSIFPSVVRADSYRYDPTTNKWEPLAPMPNARGSAAMGVHGKTIYLVGGLLADMQAVDTVSSYDTVTNTWKSLDALKLPEARDHAGSVVVNNTFYLVGGRVGGPWQNRGTVLTLDLKNPSTWMPKASMPVARGGLAVAEAAGRIWAFGGEGNKASAKGVFGDVNVYDIKKDTWETAAPMTAPRHGFGAASVGGRVYVPGGGANQGGGGMVDVNEAYYAC
ncbi:galactose oxidase [Microthyrium microscopicum]|uniref:Galactose oxidase n=1 Tax=Microthyrium microscopicum TaxID=703497 RepID=A0A6A6UEX6_9PEZI|nr:galactose oxidase [Microthyrium microscopicum]